MTMQTCDALSARQWFKLRTAANWAGIIVGFCVAVFILQTFLPLFVADLIAISVAFCVFFFVLHKRTIGIDCPSCGKYIATNTPWVCGFNRCRNEQTDDYPFIHRCQHCSNEPLAYKCHHCGELIYLSRDQQKLNYATRVNAPVDLVPPKEDNHDEDVAERRRAIELAELDLKKAGFDSELNSLNQRLDMTKPKSIRDRLRSRVGSKTELDDEVRKMKAEIDREFPNDPDERERRYQVVDDEARELL